jgi:hypothetical protein
MSETRKPSEEYRREVERLAEACRTNPVGVAHVIMNMTIDTVLLKEQVAKLGGVTHE